MAGAYPADRRRRSVLPGLAADMAWIIPGGEYTALGSQKNGRITGLASKGGDLDRPLPAGLIAILPGPKPLEGSARRQHIGIGIATTYDLHTDRKPVG